MFAFYDGLYRYNKNGVISEAIAKKCTVSSDKKTYTFTLKETVWSNGDPLTAHDFVYSWKTTLSPDFPADSAFLLYPIKNAKAVKEGTLPVSMLGVQAKDDFTLVVELERPIPYFLELVTLPLYFPVNRAVDKANPSWSRSSDTYVSNGPFCLTEWKHNNNITAMKNRKYWDKNAVELEYITMAVVDSETGFLMFENDELDWQGSPYSTIPTSTLETLKSQNRVHFNPFLGTYWIRVNTLLFPFHSEELRKAFAFAINREEITKHVTCGNQAPATGIVPVSMGLQSTPYFPDGDVEKARSLFTLALEHEGIQSSNFPEITLTYAATSSNHRIVQVLQDQWRVALGIIVKLEPVEPKVFFDRVSKKDFQLAFGNWIADFNDPISFLELFKTKSIQGNNTNWESLNYQKALEASYLAVTEDKRQAELQRAEKIIIDEMPVIPLFHHSMVHLQNERLKDVVLRDSGSIDFKWAYINE